MHNCAFQALEIDAQYLAFDVPPQQLETALGGARALGIRQLAVSLPHAMNCDANRSLGAGWTRQYALEANPRVAEEVRAGKDKALGACIGPVMQASGGKADPKRITEVLKSLIEADS